MNSNSTWAKLVGPYLKNKTKQHWDVAQVETLVQPPAPQKKLFHVKG
jgi:hypothetical protein